MQRNNILNSVEYRTNPFIPPILYPVGQTNKIIVLYTLDNQCIKTVSTAHVVRSVSKKNKFVQLWDQ